MELEFQSDAIESLRRCAESGAHSILLSGNRGTGKTHLANMFSDMIGTDEFVIVNPKTSELREVVDDSIGTGIPHVVCVENLDSGVGNASQVLLKCFEEPSEQLYMVVTATSTERVPPTILSRAVSVHLNPPSNLDLDRYAQHKDSQKFPIYRKYQAYKVCRSLDDIDEVLGYDLDTVKYFEKFKSKGFWSNKLGNLTWELSHNDSNSKIPVEIALRVVLENTDDMGIYRAALDALHELETGRVSDNAVLSRMALRIKV